MKILCVCQHGVNRSTVLATLLKLEYGESDALACGVDRNSPATLEMLFDWADKIFVVDQYVLNQLKTRGIMNDKVILIDVGTDIWGQHHHPELQQTLRDKLKGLL